MKNNSSRVLAIGIDAGEPTLIRQLIDQGQMPAFKSLLAEGRWMRVKSPANIGSGSVWPTFITGGEPSEHGVYGEWSWQPATMGLRRYNGHHLQPFWKSLRQQGLRVGILDIPFAPFTGFDEGFEISEWGPHDWLDGQLRSSPSAVADLISKELAPHPLHLDRMDPFGPRDHNGLKKLSSACVEGIKHRGTLAQRLLALTDPHLSVIVFTEIHHAGHYLWHTLQPDHLLYRQSLFEDLPSLVPGVQDIYREVDRQVGGLIEAVGPNATVCLFSLHGMRPSHGVPSFLEPFLRRSGYAKQSSWKSRSWTERAITLMAAAKRHTPLTIKRAYYKTMSPATTFLVARPTMLAPYDWEHTRAFALPADQHGWVHVNLKGREAKGIVPPEEYEEICQTLEKMLRDLTNSDGCPVVQNVVRTAARVEDAMAQTLPDLVVHWEDIAYSTPLILNGSDIVTEPAGQKFTGRHSLDGFCILKSPQSLYEGDTLPATEIHRLLTKALSGEKESAGP